MFLPLRSNVILNSHWLTLWCKKSSVSSRSGKNVILTSIVIRKQSVFIPRMNMICVYNCMDCHKYYCPKGQGDRAEDFPMTNQSDCRYVECIIPCDLNRIRVESEWEPPRQSALQIRRPFVFRTSTFFRSYNTCRATGPLVASSSFLLKVAILPDL